MARPVNTRGTGAASEFASPLAAAAVAFARLGWRGGSDAGSLVFAVCAVSSLLCCASASVRSWMTHWWSAAWNCCTSSATHEWAHWRDGSGGDLCKEKSTGVFGLAIAGAMGDGVSNGCMSGGFRAEEDSAGNRTGVSKVLSLLLQILLLLVSVSAAAKVGPLLRARSER
jgi:hypothetical protein